MHKLKQISSRLPLGDKLVIIMLGMFLTLTIFLSFYLYRDSSQVLQNQAKLILKNTAEKNKINFDYAIKETEDTAFQVIDDQWFNDFIQRYATDQTINDNTSFDFQTNVLVRLRQILGDKRKIDSIEVFLTDVSFKVTINSFATGKGIGKPTSLPQNHWEDREERISLILPFNVFSSNLRKKGYVRLNINESLFFQAINEAENKQSGFLIVDESQQQLYDPLTKNNILPLMDQKLTTQPRITGGFLLNRLALSNGWQVVTYYSLGSFHLNVKDFSKRIIFTGILVFLSALLFGRIFSQWIVWPIQRLNQHIRRTNENHLPTEISVTSWDEVGQLTASYNEMVADLNHLFRKSKQEEKAKHDAQLSAYQAQIQPHFLYNTLAILTWTAKKGDMIKVEEITKNLAKYYRLVLAKGKRIATLQEELDLVFYYLEIQKLRFSDQLAAEIRVDADIETEKLYIMHRILQPMVENALEHGIFPQGSGKIVVTVCQDEEYVYLYVADDGAGTTQETVDQINGLVGFANEERGFSLISIIQALKSYYRQNVNIYFDSVEGEGTMIEITIKKSAMTADKGQEN